MKVYLLRHGQTEYNVDKRYQGTRDIPLSEKGRAALRRADIEPDTVYVSPLCRAVDTARVLFPAERAGLNFPTGPARPLRPWWTKRWRGARKCSSSWRTAAPRWR